MGELIVGSLHKFLVIDSASRNYTWKAGVLFVIHGACHAKFWGKYGVMT